MATWKTPTLVKERCAALLDQQDTTSYLSESKQTYHTMNSYF